MRQEESNDIEYAVVLNEEEQYSIFPTFKEVPDGWKKEGFVGSKAECLSHINSVWKDMRPLSLRKKMEERQKAVDELVKIAREKPLEEPKESSVVRFLTKGIHPIRIHESESENQQFQEALERKTIHVVFEDTKGETCLRVDLEASEKIQKTPQQENLHLEGFLELDFVPLKCKLDLDLDKMRGQGTLEYRGRG